MEAAIFKQKSHSVHVHAYLILFSLHNKFFPYVAGRSNRRQSASKTGISGPGGILYPIISITTLLSTEDSVFNAE